MAKDLGMTLPEGNLSKDEIGALIQDHMSKAKEVGETEYKLKPDPMTGLSRLTRDRLNRILDNLTEKTQFPERAPGKAKQLKTKGHVLLAIREKLGDLELSQIRLGKLKGTPFPDLKEMPGYATWLIREITETSHPHMISMTQYMKLYYGLEKPDPKSEEDESSGPELMKDQPDWKEPDWTEIPTKKEYPGKPVKTTKTEPNKPPKPEWDGEAETWEEYRLKCQAWILLAKNSPTGVKAEKSSSSTGVKTEK